MKNFMAYILKRSQYPLNSISLDNNKDVFKKFGLLSVLCYGKRVHTCIGHLYEHSDVECMTLDIHDILNMDGQSKQQMIPHF